MRKFVHHCIAAFGLIVALAACTTPPASGTSDAEIARHIAARLERSGTIGRETLREHDALVRFYARRAHRPAWAAPGAVAALRETVRAADSHGLRPGDYHGNALTALAPARDDAEARAQLDILLSDAFLHLGRHLANGSVDARTLHRGYTRNDTPPDPVEALENGLQSGAPAAALEALAPPDPQYALLREKLARLLQDPVSVACPGLPDGPLVRPGDGHPRVVQLRSCLRPDADATEDESARPDLAQLDPTLAERLRDFQRSHQLVVDGILGPATTAALTATADQHIDRLRANLERWRWQPRDFGRRMVRVDIPQFRLRAFDGPSVSLEMRAVVGCRGWRTPLLHSAIDGLVLNPAWDVPRSILVKEMIPSARRDATYFTRHGLQLTEGSDGNQRRVDPRTIDWSSIDPARTTLRARQPAGPKNPLGRIKFLFPSNYGVYLHGTPGRAAFELPVRSLSHGCVRVEDELTLARFAIAPDTSWSVERLDAELQGRPEQHVALPEPLPVHLLYFTAEVAADGSLAFALDPYGWDARLLAALGADRREP